MSRAKTHARLTAAFLLSGNLCPIAGGIPLYEPVFGFDTQEQHPAEGDLVRDTDGSMLGVSADDGAWDGGQIYRVTPQGAMKTVLDFPRFSTVNSTGPAAAVTRTADGILWGTLSRGVNYGSVFRFDPVSGSLTQTAFTGNTGSLPGQVPNTALLDTGDGYLWGTTASGGAGGYGTVFKVHRATETVIHVIAFTGTTGAAKGASPGSPLLKDPAGILWGTTRLGGSAGLGVIFKINPATGTYTLSSEFTSASTGSRPSGRLQLDPAGTFVWGTTREGGSGNGIIYRINRSTNARTVIVSFTGNSGVARGTAPGTGLISDGNGSFWGVCETGGASRGTVFKVSAATSAFTTVCDFTGTTGSFRGSRPFSGLTDDGVGNFWGTTTNGGIGPGLGMGTIYKVNRSTGAFTTVHLCTGNAGGVRGKMPSGGVMAGVDGNLWGVTRRGSLANFGTVFKFSPATGALTTVLDFEGAGGTTVKGQSPAAGFTPAAGKLWNTTSGYAGSDGTIFTVDPATGGTYAQQAQFTGTGGTLPGSTPLGALTADPSGVLWGLTSSGGTAFYGTAFKIVTATSTIQPVGDFAMADSVYYPECSLARDATGAFWGVSPAGNPFGQGCIFRMTSGGAITRVRDFTGTSGATKGSSPTAGLLFDAATGQLWGTTKKGGTADFGTVFRYHAQTGVFTTVAEFTGITGSVPGAEPRSTLMRDPAGNIWGATNGGGANDAGTLFRISPAGTLTTMLEFTGMGGAAPGANPGTGALFRHTDGHLYGLTEAGGVSTATGQPLNGGQIYRLRFGPVPVTLPPAPTGSVTSVLRGTVHPNSAETTAAFEYGTTPGLSGATAISLPSVPAGSTAVPVTASLEGLTPGTTYYCRLRASNADNSIIQYGATVSFLTPLQTGYQQWIAAAGAGIPDAAPDADPDLDGLTNAAEYVLGSSPSQGSGHPIAATLSAAGITMHFSRPDSSETPDVMIEAESSSDLMLWTRQATVGSTTASSSPGVTVVENGPAADLITVSIPVTGGTRAFLRLRIVVAP